MMRTAALLAFILLAIPLQGLSQVNPGGESRGVNHSFYPLLGYSSDVGFFGGGLYQRIDYADGIRPFSTNLITDITGSTNGKWKASFEYEKTNMFDTRLRSRVAFTAERNPISNYFGIGNNTSFSETDFDEGLYYLLQRRIFTRLELRQPLRVVWGEKLIESVFRIKLSYTDNNHTGDDTRFAQSEPLGADGGWVNTIGAGLIYDIRNSEFDPRSGVRAEIGADFSPVAAGNDFGFSKYFAEITSYISLLEHTVFAQRLATEHTLGSVPYFELPSLGNQYGLRGYALDRFLGKSSVLYMAEVRSWLFRLYNDQIKLGGHVFFDTGRVFAESDSAEFFNNWKRTWGIGGAMSAFNPDLIFRGEIGFSEESYRIYAGVGFAF